MGGGDGEGLEESIIVGLGVVEGEFALGFGDGDGDGEGEGIELGMRVGLGLGKKFAVPWVG